MIPPIDVECPSCSAAPGVRCCTLHDGHHVHHAERVDAAARVSTGVALLRVTRHQELSDAEIHQLAVEDLREAYKALRDHHITETSTLATRLRRARKVYKVALDWRRQAAPGLVNPHTEDLIKVVDSAIDAEVEAEER